MHPDQSTPDSHRTEEPDSAAAGQAPPAHAPEQNQASDAIARQGERGSTEVSTHDAEQPRTGEAGNQYVGRQMDDGLKSSPRVDDARDVEGTA